MTVKPEISTSMKKTKKRCLSGPIISCLREQASRQELKNVTCPKCNSLVLYKTINHHLDYVCQKNTEDESERGNNILSTGENKSF